MKCSLFGSEKIFLHYRRSNKWSIHPSTIHQVVLPKKNASLPPTIDSAETPGPASWWNHSTPLAAWKPFKASCTPSSFSPGNNGDFTGNNDLTWFNQQDCAMTFGIPTRKNEHKWGPAGDSNAKNTSSFIALYAHIVENQTYKTGPCALSYISVLHSPLPSDPSAWWLQPSFVNWDSIAVWYVWNLKLDTSSK